MRQLYLLCAVAVGTAVGLSLLRVIRRYLSGVCSSKKLMRGKTVVITGSNTGIGKATALELAKRKAKVILGCRSMEKGREAASDIIRLSGNKEVVCFHLDLASLASVRRFAEVVLANYSQIDVLINNAGIMACPYCKTEDGFEMQFGVNHLGHFLLTNLLLDRLREAPGARIVNVSSSTYKWVKGIDFSDINSEQVYHPMKAYAQSKLANILFTNALARQLHGTGITVNSLHPGIVRTQLGRFRLQDTNILFKALFIPIAFILLKTPWEGSQTVVYCAVAEELTGVSGKYFGNCKMEELHTEASNDKQMADKLWEVSSRMVGL